MQARLTERDLTLMGWLGDHGVLTTDQIAHALYPSLDFAQRGPGAAPRGPRHRAEITDRRR
jgi:hypothetical protein